MKVLDFVETVGLLFRLLWLGFVAAMVYFHKYWGPTCKEVIQSNVDNYLAEKPDYIVVPLAIMILIFDIRMILFILADFYCFFTKLYVKWRTENEYVSLIA